MGTAVAVNVGVATISYFLPTVRTLSDVPDIMLMRTRFSSSTNSASPHSRLKA